MRDLLRVELYGRRFEHHGQGCFFRNDNVGQTKRAGLSIRWLGDIRNKNDIDALAVVIRACNLIITGSNSTAYLAAALDKSEVILHTPLRCWPRDNLT